MGLFCLIFFAYFSLILSVLMLPMFGIKFGMNYLRRAVPRISRICARSYATPNTKYLEAYQSDFTKRAFPVELLGGSHVDFAKLLWVFADQIDGKQYQLYADEFKKLDEVIAKQGPFWGEDKILDASAFQGLQPGFLFVLAWMQSEGALDRLEYVRAAYQELVNEANQEAVAVISLAQDKSTMGSKFADIEREVRAVHARSAWKNYKLVIQTKVKPELGGGYTFEVCGQVVDKSAAAAAETDSLKQASKSQTDWTAVPPAAARPNEALPDTLVRLLGSAVHDLAEIDQVELRYGA
jgi:F0F1-type ATP synthase delta subunit